MPLPLWLLGLAAGAIGAGEHISAKETNEQAQRLEKEAQDLYNSAEESLKKEQKNTEKALLQLGNTKKKILYSSFQQFINAYSKVKNIEVINSTGLDELSKFSISEQEVIQLQEMTNIYQSAISSGATGAATGAVIALAASGSLPVVTGTLSVAGSAFMAGEIGTAAGLASSSLAFGAAMTPLTAIAAPVVLFTGISASIKADENLEKAKATYAQAEAASEEMEIKKTLCKAIVKRSCMHDDLLKELDEMFAKCAVLLNQVVMKKAGIFRKKVDANDLTLEEKKLFSVSRSLAGAIKVLIDTPMLLENGSLSEEQQGICDETIQKLPEFKKNVGEIEPINYNINQIQLNKIIEELNNVQKKEYKKPSKMVYGVLWYLTLCSVLSGCTMIFSLGNLLTGIIWLAAGLLFCPKIKKEIKVSYKVIGAIILFVIGCGLIKEDDSEKFEEKQIVQENQNLDEKVSIIKNEEEKQELDESIKKLKQEPKSLTDKEQKKYINKVLAEYEETNKVPIINEPELYKENLVFDCVYKKMQKAVENKITVSTVWKSLKYQEVYENWYPDGKNMDIFKKLSKKYEDLKDSNTEIERYDKEYPDGIENAYDTMFESFNYDFYIQYKIKQGIIDSAVNKISGNNYIYYYANDVIYNEFLGELEGDEEYLIRIDAPLEKRGSQSVFGYFTGSYKTIEESGGFERELPIFHAYTNENIEKIENDYDNYIKIEKEISKYKKSIGNILQVSISNENIEKDLSFNKEQEEYVCLNSDTKKLTKKQVLKLSKKERWIAKNEIYARHGRKFNNQELQDYFNSTSWYRAVIEPEDFDESVFSKVEKANIRLLAKYE